MEKLISTLKERLNSGQYQSETAVREAIILPVLLELGWDIFDPASVIRELTLGGKRVDYALCAMPPKKDIFIEVKAVGHSTHADKQLFEYAFHEGIPFAILTDGREWNFYVPGEQGSYDERRVQKLDIVERSPADVIATFRKYLDCKRVRSGEALIAARADYQNISKRKIAQTKIPDAWRYLVAEPDELLMELIADRVETLCGYRPAPEDIEDFLITDRQVGPVTSIQVPQSMPKKTQANTGEKTPVSERAISYKIFGVAKRADNATDALIDILRSLAARNPYFLEKVAPLVKGTSRNHIAKHRNDVYPLKPELIEYTTEFVPGWWLGTNIANREKMRIIKEACKAEGLVLGKDIVITLPNAE